MKLRKKANLYFVIVLMLIVFSIFDFTLFSNYAMKYFEGEVTENGVIDVSNRNIDGGDFTYLTGDWEFFWMKHIVSDNDTKAVPDIIVNVPSSWTDYAVNGTNLKSGGYASYKTKLKGINVKKPFIIAVPNLPAAYNVFVDGQMIYTSGTVSKDMETTKATPNFLALPITTNKNMSENNVVELVIEVSCQLSNGITIAPVLVNYDCFINQTTLLIGLIYMLIGIILFTGVFAFIMSLKSKGSGRYSIWLSLLCLFLIIRIMVSNEGYVASYLLFLGMPYELTRFFVFALTFIIKLILFIYTSKSLKLKLPQNIILLFGLFFLVYASVPILFAQNIFNPLPFLLYQTSTFIFDMYILHHLCKSIVYKTHNARLYTIGYISIITGIYIDILNASGFITMRVSWIMPLSFIIFIATAVYIQVLSILESYNESKKTAELSKELAETNMSLMLSQIQPHFLYNALNTIKYLTKKDPKTAEDVIVNFSNYLRANMDSLSQREPVPFMDELNHIKNYVAIELLRFEDRLNIVYDLKSTNFSLPALTIQPLVENAIKHGINQKVDGGTVTISTNEDEKSFYVSIADDGVGYDLDSLPDKSRSHIGLMNITARLKTMLNAKVNIESKLGRGTTVLITIPKNDKTKFNGGNLHENNGG